ARVGDQAVSRGRRDRRPPRSRSRHAPRRRNRARARDVRTARAAARPAARRSFSRRARPHAGGRRRVASGTSNIKLVWGSIAFAGVRASGLPAQDPAELVLKRTTHPRVPVETSQLWLAPDAALVARLGAGAMNEFTTAVKLEVDGNF